MASSLFPQHAQTQQTNPMMQQVIAFKQMINGNPRGMFAQLMQTNPNFQTFMQNNQGKTPQQIARENGIDFNQMQSMLGIK